MEVLERIDPDKWKDTYTCKGCHSLLEVDVNDIQFQSIETPEGDLDEYTVTCPVCDTGSDLFQAFKSYEIPSCALRKAEIKFYSSGLTKDKPDSHTGEMIRYLSIAFAIALCFFAISMLLFYLFEN